MNTHPDEFPKTLQEAVRYFTDQDTCLKFVAALRWPGGVTCPHCNTKEVSFLSTRRIWKCKGCKKQFSVKVGTIFEDSPIGLDKWLCAIWMIANCKNGISSYEIHRAIGVTQKTAWFMLHRIRLAMQTGSFDKMSGEVEADETFIGGKAKNMHKDKREEKIQGRGATGKAIVMGLLERNEEGPSRVKAKVIANTQRETLHREVKQTLEKGAYLYTDALPAYRGLPVDEHLHQYVDHAIEYVNNRVHTNGLENFWSLLKRSIRGTYVSVEPEHLTAYIDEQAFRFNNRKFKDPARFILVTCGIVGKRLTYRELIGNPQGVDSPDPLRGGPRAD